MATKKPKSKPKVKAKVKAKPKKSPPLAGSRPKAGKIVVKKVSVKLGKLIGAISHYFSDINVGVIKLSAPLAKGDEIRIVGGESTDFNQKVVSMQIDHEQVAKAKKGDSVGLKIDEKAREGYKVYKV